MRNFFAGSFRSTQNKSFGGDGFMGLIHNVCHIFEAVSRLQAYFKAGVKVGVLFLALPKSRCDWWPNHKVSFSSKPIKPKGLQPLENTVIENPNRTTSSM